VVCSEPKIDLCCNSKNGSIKPAVDTKNRGDIFIKVLWWKGVGCILGVIVMDTDAKYYHNKDPHKFLEVVERLKKKKHL
jgi:hypothetical protein